MPACCDALTETNHLAYGMEKSQFIAVLCAQFAVFVTFGTTNWICRPFILFIPAATVACRSTFNTFS